MHDPKPDAGLAKVLVAWSGSLRAWSNVPRQLTDRSVNLLLSASDTVLPFAESVIVEYMLRSSTLRQAALLTEYERRPIETQVKSSMELSPRFPYSHETRLVSAAVLVLLVLAESLLRFRTTMAFEPSRSLQVPELSGGGGSRRFTAFTSLIASVRFGLRHFGILTVHIWVMRLAIFSLLVGLVEFPLALMDNFIMPNLIAHIGKSQLLPILNFAQLSAAALVSAIVLTFSTVYDVRLYRALKGYEVMPASDIARSSKSATPISEAHLRT
jgi:hypothetical protein